jgi:hypothetical protein
MTEREPNWLNDLAVGSSLEMEFNPAAQPWQANYAGRVNDTTGSELYVVGQGESPRLADFLAAQPGIDAINPIPALSNTHFLIHGTGDPVDASAAELPKKYFGYISAFVAEQLDYRPLL